MEGGGQAARIDIPLVADRPVCRDRCVPRAEVSEKGRAKKAPELVKARLIVFIHGRAKGDPMLDDVVAEYQTPGD